mgnify:CR=1 FL=1
MHIRDILTAEQLRLYIDIFRSLDAVEGIQVSFGCICYDFDALYEVECKINDFKEILAMLSVHQDIDTSGTEVEVVVSKLSDRWACYPQDSKSFFKKYELQSLGVWAQIKDIAYRVQRDIARAKKKMEEGEGVTPSWRGGGCAC